MLATGRHNSCSDALAWRRSLGPDATQADAWRLCKRGDWLLWQFERLPVKMQRAHKAAPHRAVEVIVARAVRRGVRSLRGNREPWAAIYRGWARRWLSGEDRTEAAAWQAARAARAAEVAEATWTAAEKAAELTRQARDIRREIPDWPEEVSQ